MASQATRLVRKLWQYCNVLRDDGLSYPDYVEQLTYLLFLKMADEQEEEIVPKDIGWSSFADKETEALHKHYGKALKRLSKQQGMLGVIYADARNKIRDPAKLRVLVTDLIGQSDWTGMSEDVKGDAYEGLLEKNAQDTKSGAGQYFTPRPIIDAIVSCIRPLPGEVICDPACGTGGFLLAAHEYIRRNNAQLRPAQQKHLKFKAIRGIELVREVARLATMNLLLHGIGDPTECRALPIACEDSLAGPSTIKPDVILTNPPFGVKGAFTASAEERAVNGLLRKDFWAKTGNKQLNFLQHIHTMLKPGGRAAVVVPDNVLFEGGAAEDIRRRLLTTFDVHTLLRLPTGIFYAQGVKANVLFFDAPANVKGVRSKAGKLWVYDLRSEQKFSLKSNPITAAHLVDFVSCYKPGARDEREEIANVNGALLRWRGFNAKWVQARPGCSLDISWIRESVGDQVPASDRLRSLAARVTSDLREALRLMEQAGLGVAPDNMGISSNR